MADIFISYARPDRETAKQLAQSLAARGYQVWWDADLVGSDDFRDVIFEELSLAKAVIVIWSENSVRSKFVRDEAGRADSKNKLVATCKPGFDMETLPLGFGGRHCQPVDELEQTLKALARLGVLAAAQKPDAEKKLMQEEAQAWEKIKTSQNRADFENYIRTYANSLYRAPAAIYLRKLDLLNNPKVRRAGRVGYGALKVYAWFVVYCVTAVILLAPFTHSDGTPAAPGPTLGAILGAGVVTYLIYRWYYRGQRKKNTQQQR
ncbi:MAG: toll/interleukin-1 receptor domain-containing protein [Rhodomicrobium sp.]